MANYKPINSHSMEYTPCYSKDLQIAYMLGAEVKKKDIVSGLHTSYPRIKRIEDEIKRR